MDLLIASKYHSMWGKLAVRREHPNTWQFVNTDQHRWRQPRDLVAAFSLFAPVLRRQVTVHLSPGLLECSLKASCTLASAWECVPK